MSKGQLAEQLVAQWLSAQNWQILEQRWHCRWGELDLVALTPDRVLVFVEVKARSRGNWDADGRLAITAAKRTKLILAAQAFLSEQSQLVELPCRFDVAIVQCQSTPQPARPLPPAAIRLEAIKLGCPVLMERYYLTLQDYIPAAFE